MRKSINECIPQFEAKMLAIFDFRVLKHMVARARIAQESAAGVHLRGEQDDFEEPEDVIFDQGLVIKSLRSHALAFQRLYVDFQSEGQEISVDELVKKLVKAFNRLQRNAALRSIFDIYAIADVVLVADDEVNTGREAPCQDHLLLQRRQRHSRAEFLAVGTHSYKAP